MGIYEDLGVRTIINASGTMTPLGGSLMEPDVVAAMADAARSFVDMHELHQAAGKRIAELIGVESAHVCACASAGISLMAAACMTGSDREAIEQLPVTTGLPHRFVVQKAHHSVFDRAVLVAGGRFIDIDPSEKAIETAIASNDGVAGVFFTQAWMCDGPSLDLPTVCAVAHRYGKPVIVDAAAEVPPAQNLHRFADEGADLVTFSGGKMLRGPQAAGFIAGRKDLVEACALNDAPYIKMGRGFKVGKEEIAGLVKAVEIYVDRNHEADQQEWLARLDKLTSALSGVGGVGGVETAVSYPAGIGQQIPHAVLTWDSGRVKISYDELERSLRGGDPPIAVQHLPALDDPNRAPQHEQIRVHPHMLQPGEIDVVTERITRILSGAAAR